MQKQRKHWIGLAGCAAALLLAAGCFQPAGGALDSTNVAQALPSFTPLPTDTWTPLPPPTDTATPVILPTNTEVPTLVALAVQTEGVTQVALLPNNQAIDPLDQTATAIYLLNNPSAGQPLIQVQPQDLGQPTLDPLLASATALVQQATGTAAAPLTQTAQAIFGAPTPTPIFIQPTFTSIGPVPSGQDCVYEVQPGDGNLYRISLKFGIPYMNIAQASNLVNPNLIHVGDRLIVPGCGTTGYQPPPTSTPGAGGGVVVPPSGGGGSGGTYVVRTGDTLFALSLQWNTTVEAIAAANGIANINLIYIGQTLNIP